MSLDSDYWLRFRVSGGSGDGGSGMLVGSPWRGTSGARASAFHGAVARAPQVMVKVMGRSKTAKGVTAHLDYIGREGEVVLVDQDGEVVAPDLIAEIAKDWGDAALSGPRASTKAVAITFSMPEGTDPRAVRLAVEGTVRGEIGGNNDYILAQHTDTAHPHVHLLIRGQGRDGTTYNPRPDDLHRLREGFRRELNARGIEAEATPCAFRMERQRGASMALTKMVERSTRGEIDAPRRADKVTRVEPGAAAVPPGLARPANASERKRWSAALELWRGEEEVLERDRDGPGAELAQRMAAHTRAASARGFGAVEHVARGAPREREPQERAREQGAPERNAPTLSR